MEKSIQDRIDYLISIKAVPPGFAPEQPDPSFVYSGDLYSARTLTLLKKIECSLLSEVEEWLEANNHTGRFYLYPENKRAAQGIKIILELESREQETLTPENENPAIKAVRLEMQVQFLERENRQLSENIKKAEEEIKTLTAKSGEKTVFDQFIALQQLHASGAGQVAGIEKLMETFAKGQEAGTGASTKTIELLELRIKQLESEKADLKTEYESQISDMEEELENYRKRVGELPQASPEDDLTTSVAKTVLEIGKDWLKSKTPETQSQLTSQKGPAPMSLEKKLIPVIIQLWGDPPISFEEVAKQMLPVLAKDTLVGNLIKTMSPEIIADFVSSKIRELNVFPGIQDSDMVGLKADLTELAKVVKRIMK